MLADGCLGDDELPGDGDVGVSFGDEGQDFAFSRRELRQRVALPAQQLAHYLGVDHGSAARHAAQRGDEILDIDDAVFEQVADSSAAGGVEQLEGVAVLHVLAERDDRQLRVGAPQFHGGAQSLVGVTGGHPDIGDHQVRGTRPRVRAPACPAGHSPQPPVRLREPGARRRVPGNFPQIPPSSPGDRRSHNAGRRAAGATPGSSCHRDVHRHLPGRDPARGRGRHTGHAREALPRRSQPTASRTELPVADRPGWPDAPAPAARHTRPGSGLRARQRRARPAASIGCSREVNGPDSTTSVDSAPVRLAASRTHSGADAAYTTPTTARSRYMTT